MLLCILTTNTNFIYCGDYLMQHNQRLESKYNKKTVFSLYVDLQLSLLNVDIYALRSEKGGANMLRTFEKPKQILMRQEERAGIAGIYSSKNDF